MGFPAFDQYWTDTANFVQTNYKEGDKVVAPLDFEREVVSHLPILEHV